MAKILVVDDEPDAVELVEFNLKNAGFEVVTAADGEQALKKARAALPDLIVLDLMLPEVDGLEVCKLLRRDAATAGIPILMLTAKAAEIDRVLGLELGADDYVTKPFSLKEIMARVKRLVARGPMNTGTPATTVYKFGDVEVRFEPREVYKAGEQVALSYKEFELLKYLIEHVSRTVSREELLEEIWGVDEELGVTTRTVDTHVSNLRSKLGEGFEKPFIVAVHKVGYKFVES